MSKKNIIRSIGIISSTTLLSRILGFIRDMLMASYFGSTYVADAFLAAFRIPNVLRRLFGEGALSSVFIPIFADYNIKKGKKEAFKFASAMFNILFIIVAIVSFLGSYFSYDIISFIDSGFSDEKAIVASKLLKIMFFYLFFISLTALLMGILNSLKHFFFPALSPVMLNISLIFAMIFFVSNSSSMFEKAKILSYTVIIGGILQFLIQLPILIKKGFNYSFIFKHPGVKQAFFMLIPATGALAIHEINLMVDDWFTSHISSNGSFSYLYYGNRLMQFPLGVFGIAVSTALIPIISNYAALKDIKNVKRSLIYSIKIILFITIPCTAGLLSVGLPLIKLMFQRGKFNEISSQGCYIALFYYSLGLSAFAILKILIPVFYAFKDSLTPLKTGIFSVCVNILLNYLLIDKLKHGGLALASSIAGFSNLFILLFILKKKIGNLGLTSIIKNSIKILSASIIMSIICFKLTIYFSVILVIPFGISIFIFLAYIFKMEEYKEIKLLIKQKYFKK